MQVRYLFEPRRGKGYAYNTGMAAAQGAALLFTDDDVKVPPNWVEGMCTPIIAGAADAVAGGVSIPEKLACRIPCRQALFAGTKDINAIRPDRFVGANMAFSRKVFESIGGFDVNLGPGALGFHDETLYSYLLCRKGFRLVSRFDVVVEHHFDPSRLTRRGLLDLAMRMGKSDAYLEYHYFGASATKTAWPLWFARLRLLKHRLLHPLPAASGPHLAWEMERVQQIWMLREIRQYRGTSRKYCGNGHSGSTISTAHLSPAPVL